MKGWALKMAAQTIAELFDLTGKGAIVTGAGSGIGQAIALRLAEAGASVMITDIDLETANQTVEQIKGRGGNALSIYADASSPTDARKATRAVADAFGSLDILVNNAAVYPFSLALEMSEEIWDKVLDVNLKGMFFYSQAAAREMVKAGHGGKIINLASIDGLHPTIKGMSHYIASKGGVIALTKALAVEFAPYNILVNSVAPGAIVTPGSMAQAADVEAHGEPLEELWKNFMVRLPLGHMGEPDDIAKVVLFLASAAADYMTGSLLLADGGYLIS